MSRLSELIGDLNARPHRDIEVPGREGETAKLWALTQREGELARKAAYEHVARVKFSALELEYDEQRALHDAVMRETLAVALRDPEDTISTYAADADEIHALLDDGTIQALFLEYLKYVAERSPLRDVADPEKALDDLVEACTAGFPLATRLSHYASPALRTLLLSAVDRLSSGTTASSSAT